MVVAEVGLHDRVVVAKDPNSPRILEATQKFRGPLAIMQGFEQHPRAFLAANQGLHLVIFEQPQITPPPFLMKIRWVTFANVTKTGIQTDEVSQQGCSRTLTAKNEGDAGGGTRLATGMNPSSQPVELV
jgi:hypothetical protein